MTDMRINFNLLKNSLVAVAMLALCLSLCACDFDDSKDIFKGGEILDENVMQSIRDSIITTETTNVKTDITTESTSETASAAAERTTETTDAVLESTIETTDAATEITTEEITEIYTESNTESKPETESKETSETETVNTETDTENTEDTVYWLASGEVWHVKRDCRHIKNKEVASGTVEQAKEAGKARVCGTCGK